MAKSKLTLPTSIKPKVEIPALPDLPVPPAADEKVMNTIIGKGGSVPSEKTSVPAQEDPDMNDPLKTFTIRIYRSELDRIKRQQDAMRKRDRISMEEYILRAINNQLTRDEKKLATKSK